MQARVLAECAVPCGDEEEAPADAGRVDCGKFLETYGALPLSGAAKQWHDEVVAELAEVVREGARHVFFELWDTDHSGKVDVGEFIAGARAAVPRLRAQFKRFCTWLRLAPSKLRLALRSS